MTTLSPYADRLEGKIAGDSKGRPSGTPVQSRSPLQNSKRRIYTGISRGTLGELFQGPYTADGVAAISIISLPIDRFSWAYFDENQSFSTDSFADRSKTKLAIEQYLKRNNLQNPLGRWEFHSELERGRGMASSTADIVAAVRCLDAIFGRASSSREIAEILGKIERSDSVFLDNFALYLSGKQRVIHHFSGDPQLFACYIDEGQIVDTEQMADVLLSHYGEHEHRYSVLLKHVIDAFRWRSPLEICQCATESAILSQSVMPKKTFEDVLANRRELQADGIIVAHTGSILGYLFCKKPHSTLMGELSTFFRGLGFQCRFGQTGIA